MCVYGVKHPVNAYPYADRSMLISHICVIFICTKKNFFLSLSWVSENIYKRNENHVYTRRAHWQHSISTQSAKFCFVYAFFFFARFLVRKNIYCEVTLFWSCRLVEFFRFESKAFRILKLVQIGRVREREKGKRNMKTWRNSKRNIVFIKVNLSKHTHTMMKEAPYIHFSSTSKSIFTRFLDRKRTNSL